MTNASLSYFFPNLKSVCCYISGSNCCFLTHVQLYVNKKPKIYYDVDRFAVDFVLSVEKEMATYTSVPAWRIPWTDEPRALWSMKSQRVRPDWRDLACMHCIICEKSKSLSTLFFDLLNIWNALDSGSTVWKAFIWIAKVIFPWVIVCVSV